MRAYKAGIAMLATLVVACSGNGGSNPTHISVQSAPPGGVATTGVPGSSGISYANPQKYQVTYQVAVKNGDLNVTRLLVYQPKPVSWDGQADVAIDQVTPAPTRESVDTATGSGIYNWDLSGKPGKGESLPFTIGFTFTAYETHTNIAAAEVKPYDTTDPSYVQYTSAERFIESGAADISALSASIAAGETNPLLEARKFYDYVIDNSSYVATGTGLHGASALLGSGQGECGDYASLFIALSRAAGIPARPVVGNWAYSGLDQTHVWAEFFLQGFGWVPVDPTVGQSQPDKRDFYFGNMDNTRVILNKGFNIALTPPTPDNYVAPFLQMPLWWFWGNGDTSSIRLDRVSWIVTPQ